MPGPRAAPHCLRPPSKPPLPSRGSHSSGLYCTCPALWPPHPHPSDAPYSPGALPTAPTAALEPEPAHACILEGWGSREMAWFGSSRTLLGWAVRSAHGKGQGGFLCPDPGPCPPSLVPVSSLSRSSFPFWPLLPVFASLAPKLCTPPPFCPSSSPCSPFPPPLSSPWNSLHRSVCSSLSLPHPHLHPGPGRLFLMSDSSGKAVA